MTSDGFIRMYIPLHLRATGLQSIPTSWHALIDTRKKRMVVLRLSGCPAGEPLLFYLFPFKLPGTLCHRTGEDDITTTPHKWLEPLVGSGIPQVSSRFGVLGLDRVTTPFSCMRTNLIDRVAYSLASPV